MARTPGPWKWHSRIEDLNGTGPLQTGSIYAYPRDGHAYSVAVAPRYQTEERWKSDAAAIVKWEATYDDLVAALETISEIASDDGPFNFAQRIARAALAKAK